jgi:hypothetical protein
LLASILCERVLLWCFREALDRARREVKRFVTSAQRCADPIAVSSSLSEDALIKVPRVITEATLVRLNARADL